MSRRPRAPGLGSGLALVGLLSLAACRLAPTPPGEPAAAALPAPSGPRVRFERAGAGEVASLVRAALATSRAEGRTLLVYVGASWCEPCAYFHAAAEQGALEDALPPLLLLEFDRDQDGARLDGAGYGSRMIPLFAVPAADGRASERRIEGSIHGPGSPREIAPRLRAILTPG